MILIVPKINIKKMQQKNNKTVRLQLKKSKSYNENILLKIPGSVVS